MKERYTVTLNLSREQAESLILRVESSWRNNLRSRTHKLKKSLEGSGPYRIRLTTSEADALVGQRAYEANVYSPVAIL